MRFDNLFLVLTLLAGISGCVAPVQNGGVVTMPGAAARLEYLCRVRETTGICAVDEGSDESDGGIEGVGSR